MGGGCKKRNQSWLSSTGMICKPAFLLGLCIAPQVIAEPLMLRPAVVIAADGAEIDLGSYAIPCVVDWNGDGRKDLLVGYRFDDKVVVFPNSGTSAEPVFGQPSPLQANGADIQVPGSGCGAPAPWAGDYDADGLLDLLVGDGSNGTVHFYRNIHTNAQPILAADVQLRLGTGLLAVVSRATPCVADWDDDGLNDLLCGDGNGNVSFYKNVGTAQSPAYVIRVLLQAGGFSLNLGIRSVPRVFDWDGDGLQDLVGSSTTGVYWCRNTNNRTAPVLQSPVALTVPKADASGSLTPIYTGDRMRLDLADWDDDGVMDLILGNLDGTVCRYSGYHFRFSRIQYMPQGELILEWASSPMLKYSVLAGSSPDQINTPFVTGHPSGGTVTTWSHHPTATARFYRIRVGP